ncbi:MAG: helix-turn-helix domain-containing protein [Clostridia bacterium]|nr:helix-turn-helix domain-containing protein [Clostridia bacterium]
MTTLRLLLNVNEVAEILRVNKGSVYALIHSGRLSAIKFGTYKVPAFEVENFLHKYSGCDLTDLNNIKTLN